MTSIDDIKGRVKGRWLSIVRALGIEIPEDGKHGLCPICGKEHHFRFDDKEGDGTWICVCSAGDGWALVQEVLGLDFVGAVDSVREVIGECRVVIPREKKKITREQLREMFNGADRIKDGDVVSVYLKNRGLAGIPDGGSLWFSPGAWEPETKSKQKAMLAVYQMPDSQAVCIHRTYLDEDGNKLDIDKVKKISPSLVKNISGGAVRLFSIEGHESMGVTEGIESAIAAEHTFKIPFWAATTAQLLENFTPPQSIKHVMIVADNDKSFTGQAAAYSLAKKIVLKHKKTAEVYIPLRAGTDILDEMLVAKMD